MAASWSGSRVGPTEYKVAARSFAPDGGLPSVRCSLACFQCEYGSRYGEAGSTVLRRGKWWVLAMLGPPVKNGRPCAWLRSRRASARRICQAFRSVPFRWCRDEGRPDTSTQRARRAASNKGLGFEAASRAPRWIRYTLHRSVHPYVVEAQAESA
jgi:hypothetical protein